MLDAVSAMRSDYKDVAAILVDLARVGNASLTGPLESEVKSIDTGEERGNAQFCGAVPTGVVQDSGTAAGTGANWREVGELAIVTPCLSPREGRWNVATGEATRGRSPASGTRGQQGAQISPPRQGRRKRTHLVARTEWSHSRACISTASIAPSGASSLQGDRFHGFRDAKHRSTRGYVPGPLQGQIQQFCGPATMP